MPDMQARAMLSMAQLRLGLSIDAVTYEEEVVWVERVGGEPVSLASKPAMRLFFFLRSCHLLIGERGLLFGPARSRFNPTSIDCSFRIRIGHP